MSRAIETGRRAELLHEVVRYLQTHGIADLSLSPMAAELGTSKRMLLYYFGSREELITQALDASRPSVADIFSDAHDSASLRAAARQLWNAITVGRQHGPIQILLQILALATTRPDRYQRLAADSVTVMVEPIATVYTRLGHTEQDGRAKASLLVSGLRGLCQDRLVTHDAERTDAAAHALIDYATSPAV